MPGRSFTALALVIAAVLSVVVRASGPFDGQRATALPDVFTKSMAYYAALTSYSDTGTVKVETSGMVENSRFTTYFRRSTRDLYIDFQALTSITPANKFTIDLTSYRTVIWMFKGEMQTYDFRSQSLDAINPEDGGQVRALQLAAHGTKNVSILIPSLLYSQARLPSAFLQIETAELAGVESIDGRRCHKIIGVAAAYYPSGQRTSVRPVTVWVDAETQLVRRIFEDTPKGVPAGSYLRTTTTFAPQANPAIDDGKLQFKVPS